MKKSLSKINSANPTHVKPILWRLLFPLSLLLILIIAGASIFLFMQHKARLNDQLEMMNDRMTDAYGAEVRNLAESLEFALIPIASNPHIKQCIESGDKDSLYKTWQPIYEKLNRQFAINHFTFMDKYRRRILRVHLPEQSEGIVNRQTILEAERTGKVAWGIELEMGSFETPTLRVVQPVLTDNKMVGYIELGEDIDDLLKEIHERTDNHLIATVFKEKTDPKRWAETMAIFNREADWDKLNDAAIFYTTLNEIPNSLIDIINSKGAKSNGNKHRIDFDDRMWQVSGIGITDAAGNEIGDLIFMIDATQIIRSFRKSTIFGSVFISLLFVILLGFIYYLLKRTDKLIVLQQSAIVEGERNYKELFNSVADSIVIYDLEGKFIDYNENVFQLYGYTRSELKDLKPQDIVHPDSHSILKENQLRIRAGETTMVESVHLRKNGTGFPVEIKSLMIQMGEKPVIISVIRDISDRKMQDQVIKNQSDWMDALLKTPTEGLWVVDSTNRFVLVNDAYIRMSGYTKNELLNMTIPQLEASEKPDDVEKHIKNIIEKGWDIFESKHRRKDGSIYDVQVSVSFDTDRNELYGYIRDITEEKKAKEVLEHLNYRFSIAEHAGNLGVWEWNIITNDSYWSDNLYEIFGHKTNAVMPTQSLFEKHIHPDDAEDVYKTLNQAKEQSLNKFTFDFRIVNMDGETRWLSSQAIVLLDENNIPEKVIGVCQDVTDKVMLEQELKLKDNAIQNSITGIALSGSDGVITYVNNAFNQLWGYESDQEVVGRSLFEFWQNPDDIVEITESIKASNSWTGKRVARRMDGSTFHCQISANFLNDTKGNGTYFMGSFWDITEMIQTQEKLAASEHQYHLLFKQSPYGVLLIDINTGQTIESNETAAQQLGYTLEEILSIKISDYEVAFTPEEIFNKLKSVESGKKEEFDTLHRTKSGNIRNVRVNVQPIVLQNRKYVFAIVQDITARVESESLYNNILKTAIDGFFILDLKGKIVEINDAYCEMVGYSRDELLNMHIFDVEALEDIEATKEHIKKVFDSGKDRFETRHKHKNGKEILVEANVIYLEISGGMIVSFIKDITDRKEKEELVLNSLKEKELLLREIHHRVKNNLQIISSLLYLQSLHIKDEAVLEMFQISLNRIKSMALLHEFLYKSDNLNHIDFKNYVEELVSVIKSSYGNNLGSINIKLDVQSNIRFDQVIYCGLIVNELINNALKYAFKDRSTGEIQMSVNKRQSHIQLNVTDNGIGIPDISIVDKSDSLGFKIVKELTRQLKGTMKITSDNGTCVKIKFPAG